MMRLAMGVAAAVLLAGCGGGSAFTGDAKAVNDLCLKNNGTAAYCECTTKALQAKLSPEVFAQVARATLEGDTAATFDVMSEADKSCTVK